MGLQDGGYQVLDFKHTLDMLSLLDHFFHL